MSRPTLEEVESLVRNGDIVRAAAAVLEAIGTRAPAPQATGVPVKITVKNGRPYT